MVSLEKVLRVPWRNAAAVEEAIKQRIPALVSADQAFQNARRHSGCENTQVEAEAAIRRAISVLLADYLDLFTQFTQDSDFRKCMTSVVLEAIATEQTGVETQRLSGDPPQPQ